MALSSEFKIFKRLIRFKKSKALASEFKICKGFDVEIRGAPSVQGPTLELQDL